MRPGGCDAPISEGTETGDIWDLWIMEKLSLGWSDVWSGRTSAAIFRKVVETEHSGGTGRGWYEVRDGCTTESSMFPRSLDPSGSGTIKGSCAAEISGVSMFMLNDSPQDVTG